MNNINAQIMSVMALVALLVAALAPAANAEKPNVLMIAVDDLNDWVGCLGGHPQSRTPNIDRLAKHGTLFTNAHCQGTMCNPSRISLLWGRRPSSTGFYDNHYTSDTPMEVRNFTITRTTPTNGQILQLAN